MKPLNTILIKLTLCLILGILLSHYVVVTFIFSIYFSIICFGFLTLTYYSSRKHVFKTIWFGCSSYIMMLSLGILSYTINNEKNHSKHYTNISSIDCSASNTLTYKIRERLKPSSYHEKYIVDLISINDQLVMGNSLLNIEKDSIQTVNNVDDVLLSYSEFEILAIPLNPNQFNYKAYLEKQYIYHQISIHPKYILKLSSQRNSIFGYAEQLRQSINKKLNQYNFKSDELAVINALILGQRQDMDRTIYNDYVNAGAIHILAVSGLHVGIILLLLNVVLKPLEHLNYGKPIKVISILSLLWSFAIIAGLSASVTRAVTMFSIVAIAMNLKRPGNIYNTLAISVFILLLFKPMFLFDVGFQMSYLAVIAIVSIQPILYKLWSPKWKIINYFWQILTVTLAAQLGVVPVSLYYFHQFPGLFFISNLAIIPVLGLILGFGIFIIILAVLDLLPSMIANLYANIISTMNTIVSWVAKQEHFLFRDISFELSHVLASYLLIITLVFLYKKPNFKYLAFSLVSILIIQGVLIFTNYRKANNSFIIFHKSRYSMIGQKMHSELKVDDNLDSLTAESDKVITNFSVGNFITSTKRDTLKSVYQIQNISLLIIDSLGVYNVKSFQPNYVLLRNSPRINLERMIDSIHPQLIIADGSNYKSYIKRWKATCSKRKLPFHYTGEKGAFIWNE